VWQSVRKETPGALSDPDSHDDVEVAAMLREPTALVVQVGSVGYEVEVSNRSTIQLDLAGRIDDIADLASVGAITPSDAVAAVAAARTMQPRFGPIATVVAYAVTTVGFGVVINPTGAPLPAYAFLRLVVGAVVLLGRPFPALNPILPTLSAALITVLATWFVADAANDGLLRVISPPLVAMLPGMSLTIGSMELASSEIVAGASRLIYGVTQLMLLVFGVALGMHIAGRVAAQDPSPRMGDWALYVAIVVVAVGLYVYLSAPEGSLFWLMAAIGVALVGQQIGGLALPASYSGAVGAFLVVPFAMWALRIKGSPRRDRDDAGGVLGPGARCAELRLVERSRNRWSRHDQHPRHDRGRDLLDRPGHVGRIQRFHTFSWPPQNG
jgi:uncharacterized membrane protein YjjP (DUF1212 family)